MTASEKQQMQNIVALIVVTIVNAQLFLFQAEDLFTFKKYGPFCSFCLVNNALFIHYLFLYYSASK